MTDFPIKPKTGWRFRDWDSWVPLWRQYQPLIGAHTKVEANSVLMAMCGGRMDEETRLQHLAEQAGSIFRLREYYYDGLHGLGPVGEIRRKCG